MDFTTNNNRTMPIDRYNNLGTRYLSKPNDVIPLYFVHDNNAGHDGMTRNALVPQHESYVKAAS